MATATSGSDISFLVPGEAAATRGAPAGPARGVRKASVRVGVQRSGGEALRVSARPGEDVVVLGIANGPTLVLHPEDARDLMRAQGTGVSATAARGANVVSDGATPVPAQLGWPGLEATATRGATRGWMGRVLLNTFEVVTGLGVGSAGSFASAAVVAKVDGAVDAGVYALSADALTPLKGSSAKRPKVPAAAEGGPLLVLLHGTFVDTVSTFGKLWTQHPQTVRELFGHYGGRVYALDHPTLAQSPIANALTLVRALPAGARLHLLTHSRGGLVAEVLARACAGAPPGADELALFADPGYVQHRTDLLALVAEAQAKQLKVDRVVRVACPARGTLLASRRFDAYLSVLQWSLGLAGVPVAAELVDLLHEVARRRADPAELPGLEAMMPGSPVVAWLNAGRTPIAGELRVVAGDMEGDSIGSWVKTLLSDAFYWTDNDLVVQTRSMYGGTPRAAACFMLDRGAKVSHFNYFANERTVQAIAAALTEPQAPASFSAIGPLSWAGTDASGTRAARAVALSRSAVADPAQRPAVFVLPGILGSNLKLDAERIWLALSFVNALKRLAWDPATAARVTPDGPIGASYDRLIEHLALTHEVIPFAFDWRRPIEDEAQRLADAVVPALVAREASGQPVRLLAHSMGGLVARTMQLVAPEVWSRLMAHDGARLLMLGTPNGGSWAPMQVLSGDDTFGNALVAFGALFDNGGARKMMAGMPGFIQMQAGLLDPALNLGQAASWQKLADDDIALLEDRSHWHTEGQQLNVYRWGAPPQAVLDQAVALRRRLDAQAAALGDDARKMLLVVGHARFTPAGITLGNEGLEYLNTPDDGDGRVTLGNALLPGVRTWKLDAAHGDLPNVADAFAAYVELLGNGDTTRLPPLQAAASARGAADPATMVRSRPSRAFSTSAPPSTPDDIQGLAPQHAGARPPGAASGARTALRVAVLNGDLKFVAQPLLVGHYRSEALSGTEAVVDALIGGGMRQAMAAGLYPDAAGSQRIFVNLRRNPDNPLAMPRPRAVVVAGLGEEGKLSSGELVQTVRQAVLAYALHLAQQDSATAVSHYELAATLLGSGGIGITAGSAAQLIAQGAREANERAQDCGWPQLSRLTLIEVYLDRASEAWRALQAQAAATSARLEVLGTVQFGTGALRRPMDAGYRGAQYDFISVVSEATGTEQQRRLSYTLDTRRARTEVRAQRTQGNLLVELVRGASNDGNRDAQIGRTLFKLLVPVELEPFLGGTSEMQLVLDPGSAAIPWELLDNADGGAADGDPRPWAIRAKLLRKLRTETFRERVADASAEDNVLVIGEPLCDHELYPPLPGARAEAEAVFARLTGAGGVEVDRVRALLSGADDARSIINALHERHYRVVHIAGHGAPGAMGGVVLSEKTFLGATEVEAMRSVPELVFLNCCHLGGRDAASAALPYDRAAFAATIAQELIEIGVRCVIAAGWAVEDGPAETFAETFYAGLLRGARFIDAVAGAREAAWRANPQGNTWAAYQCYGDPGWIWRRGGGDAQRPTQALGDEFNGIASPLALTLALETLSTASRFSAAPAQTQRDKLRFLEARHEPEWGAMGAVAEAFGVAFADAQDTDKAIAWYTRAVQAEDGSASFKAAEQLANLRARRGEKRQSATQARSEIRAAIASLEELARLHASAEREALLGSAWKRLAMVEARAPEASAAEQQALRKAVEHYGKAERLKTEAGNADLFYPALNAIAAELRLAFLQGQPAQLAEARIATVRESLRTAATERPDFWCVVGQIELGMLQALARGELARIQPGLLQELNDLKARVPAAWMWDSVWAQARFTLEPYLARATAGEQEAAGEMLKALKGMAERCAQSNPGVAQ